LISSTSSHPCSAMTPTKTRLQYANGYLELGMINEASEEIESILGEDRMSMAVMSFRMKMYRQAEYWPALEAARLYHICACL
jgi:Tfp pilus assembly protein PilF